MPVTVDPAEYPTHVMVLLQRFILFLSRAQRALLSATKLKLRTYYMYCEGGAQRL
jgi:hypothetical protein